MLKNPEFPNGSAGSFIVKIWGEYWKVHDFLWLIRGGNRTISRASEVTVLHLGEDLASHKRTRKYWYVHPLRRNQYSPLAVLLFLDCSVFVSVFPLFPISNCWNLQFGTQGWSRRLNEAHFLQIRNCAWSLSPVQLFVTPWTVGRQAPLSIGILQARILE